MAQDAPDEDLPSTLCLSCGMCCDGTLYEAGRLEPGEADIFAGTGLRIDAANSVFLLPCPALSGKCCSTYGHRPRKCATFRCRLLRDVMDNDLRPEEAKERIATTSAMAQNLREMLPDGVDLRSAQRDAAMFLRNGALASDSKLPLRLLAPTIALMRMLDLYFRNAGKTILDDERV